ncbi:MAG: hypothetical protein KUG79_19090 [Pseudomonadales bacterium]|nr:hypothetical protein [Pseudomonadales bacterium]
MQETNLSSATGITLVSGSDVKSAAGTTTFGMGVVLMLLMLLMSCVSEAPIVDKKGGNEAQYQQDLAECREYAKQISTPAAAARKGAIQAAVGGVLGAVIGDHRTAGKIAGVGAVSGSARGAAGAEQRKTRVVHQCLRGRGYKVLG